MFSLVCNKLHFDRTSDLASLYLVLLKKIMLYFHYFSFIKTKATSKSGQTKGWPTYLAGQLRTEATVRAGC